MKEGILEVLEGLQRGDWAPGMPSGLLRYLREGVERVRKLELHTLQTSATLKLEVDDGGKDYRLEATLPKAPKKRRSCDLAFEGESQRVVLFVREKVSEREHRAARVLIEGFSNVLLLG